MTFSILFNFRDLGGYATVDGRTVARGRIFRSDDLCRLAGADDDLAAFEALGIRTVVDLRRPTEVAQFGRVPVLDGLTYHHVHLVHPLWPQAPVADVEARVDFLLTRYGEMAVASAEGIGTALRLIADSKTAPLVVHCIAGKDRTGIVSALTLSLLGVDDETVAEDYALSEPGVAAFHAWNGTPGPVVASTPPQVMLRFLAALRAGHGSIEDYARSLGVTDDHLAELRGHMLD